MTMLVSVLLLISVFLQRVLIVTKEKKAMDFEKQLESLESLVEALETGNLSLEDSLKSFEQGIKVARECQAALKQAEQKVELLTRQGDELLSEPFESAE
jgi:exodeoxyribonuclease VII small subunit